MRTPEIFTGVSVYTEGGGIVSVCVNAPEGEIPEVHIGVQKHEKSMDVAIAIADAAVIARAIEKMVSRFLAMEEP